MSNWLRNFGAARESAFFKVEQARLLQLGRHMQAVHEAAEALASTLCCDCVHNLHAVNCP